MKSELVWHTTGQHVRDVEIVRWLKRRHEHGPKKYIPGGRYEDIVDLLVLCPWYVSVIVSGAVYVGLKYYLPTIQTESIFTNALIQAIPDLAWIVALFLLIPAPVSAIRSHRKKTLLNKQKGLKTIRDLEWRDFEFMVAQAYRQQGYRVLENENAGPDDGIDILIEKDGNRYVVQCKQWRSSKVGVQVVREMFGVV